MPNKHFLCYVHINSATGLGMQCELAQDTTFGGPPPCPPGSSFEQLLESIAHILDIFVARGYALSVSAAALASMLCQFPPLKGYQKAPACA